MRWAVVVSMLFLALLCFGFALAAVVGDEGGGAGTAIFLGATGVGFVVAGVRHGRGD